MNKLQAAALAAAVSLTAGIIGCNLSDPAPFDPHTLGQSERLASTDVRTYPMHPLPTTLQSEYLPDSSGPTTAPSTGPSLGTEPQTRMTLQEIVHRAVANSSDIKVAAYQPAIDQTRVIEAEARFDPTVFANAQVQRLHREFNFAQAGANGNIQKETDYTASFGIRQQLESGGSIELRNQSTIVSNQQLQAAGAFGHNPSLQNEFVLQVTQPLLRDFGNEINRARIVINRNNQRISLLEFRKQLEETIADIEKTYWDLVQAEQNVRIQEDLVSQTIDTAQRLVGRRGEVARVQISQTNSNLQQRISDLIRFKARVKDLSAQLKKDMNDPEIPISGPTIVLPADPPQEDAVMFDQQDVIDTALANRLELGEQQLRVDSATTALQVGKNNLLPQLNAAGSISLEALSGGGAGLIDDYVAHDYVSWSFGLEFEIPIGNRAARATYERALMQRAQAIDSYAAAIATVSFECDSAMRDVHTAWDTLGSDRQSVFASADALHWVQDREAQGGETTPEFLQLKLQYQSDYAQSRRAEASSLANYNQAIAKLEQVKGTLLQYNNVLMQQDMIPFERKWASAK